MNDPRRSTQRFGDRAGAYAAHRPSYPAQAVDAALDGLGDPGTLAVVDVGAGTGISARLFAERGARVVAVEPNAPMREAARPHERVTWIDGTAEHTGLPDRSADVVAVCQAFHWFATPEAMAEMSRIARRRVALLQYERDESDPFTRAYGDIVRTYARDDTEALRAAALRTFEGFPGGGVRRLEIPSRQHVDLAGVLGRAASSSYLPKDGAQADAMRDELHQTFARFARDGGVDFAMTCYVLLADVR